MKKVFQVVVGVDKKEYTGSWENPEPIRCFASEDRPGYEHHYWFQDDGTEPETHLPCVCGKILFERYADSVLRDFAVPFTDSQVFYLFMVMVCTFLCRLIYDIVLPLYGSHIAAYQQWKWVADECNRLSGEIKSSGRYVAFPVNGIRIVLNNKGRDL